MHDFFYHGVWRMDWGLGNPNKTAALIVTLMIAVWILAHLRKWGFWFALVLFTALGIGLIHTFSRGGIIALFLGVMPLIWLAERPWPWSKIAGITLSVWIMVGFTILLNAQDRYGQGVIKEDRSIGNRLEVWKAAPHMMADAPNGWGIGNSGQAYMEWYQPLNRNEEYRTLVNSHLTWLVEISWPLRFLYVASWIGVFLLCWPNSGIRVLSIPLGVWLAFAIAAVFSSAAESIWLWIVPMLCLLTAITLRYQKRQWPKPILWTVPFALSAAMMAIVLIIGHGGAALRAFNGGVVIGKEPPEIWVMVNRKVMGQNYGHTIRRYLSSPGADKSSIGVVENLAAIPNLSNATLVLGGTIPDIGGSKATVISAKRIVLLNPYFYPKEIDPSKEHFDNIKVLFGEFGQSPSAYAWRSASSVERVPGAGDFLPRWPELAFTLQ